MDLQKEGVQFINSILDGLFRNDQPISQYLMMFGEVYAPSFWENGLEASSPNGRTLLSACIINHIPSSEDQCAIIIDPFYECDLEYNIDKCRDSGDLKPCATYLIGRVSDSVSSDILDSAFAKCHSFNPICIIVNQEDYNIILYKALSLYALVKMSNYMFIEAFDGTDYVVWRRR